MPRVSRWYPSKIDTWLAVVLAIAPLVSVAGAAASIAAGAGAAIGLGAVGFMALIYAGLVFPMRYGITDEAIVIRHGLVRQRIPLRDILEVTPTNNPLSAPALSLERLAIRFGEGVFKTIMISPADRVAFLDELATRAGLQREGERLLRAPPR